ncbi:hypothetical protein Pth03_44550 [Planotetraspora thailandica]|uniref:Uncharacterized protein n=1 Tax=Planotetraspora thailandica TaxID=487172 RepID=A0A8J3V3F0_9ACTN|nr:hypothetical protein Pth03_44550 [Planotetraspora thailandica]
MAIRVCDGNLGRYTSAYLQLTNGEIGPWGPDQPIELVIHCEDSQNFPGLGLHAMAVSATAKGCSEIAMAAYLACQWRPVVYL